jgi:hypothetical protein
VTQLAPTPDGTVRLAAVAPVDKPLPFDMGELIDPDDSGEAATG